MVRLMREASGGNNEVRLMSSDDIAKAAMLSRMHVGGVDDSVNESDID